MHAVDLQCSLDCRIGDSVIDNEAVYKGSCIMKEARC